MSNTCVVFILNNDIIFAQSRTQPSVINHSREGHRNTYACLREHAQRLILSSSRTEPFAGRNNMMGRGTQRYNNNNNCRNQRQKTRPACTVARYRGKPSRLPPATQPNRQGGEGEGCILYKMHTVLYCTVPHTESLESMVMAPRRCSNNNNSNAYEVAGF